MSRAAFGDLGGFGIFGSGRGACGREIAIGRATVATRVQQAHLVESPPRRTEHLPQRAEGGGARHEIAREARELGGADHSCSTYQLVRVDVLTSCKALLERTHLSSEAIGAVRVAEPQEAGAHGWRQSEHGRLVDERR